jgi:hypothetical protein
LWWLIKTRKSETPQISSVFYMINNLLENGGLSTVLIVAPAFDDCPECDWACTLCDECLEKRF